jgi:hypothetical protein
MDWLSLPDFTELPSLLAQTPSPSPSPSTANVELLKSQLEFLKAENARAVADFADKLKLVTEENKSLSESFKNFVGTMQFALGTFTFLGAAAAFIFGKTLNDAKTVANQMIEQKVEANVANKVRDAVDAQIDNVKQLIGREKIISSIVVDYYSPSSELEPIEARLLRERKFREVRFRNLQSLADRRGGHVTVLDLVNYNVIPQPEADGSMAKDKAAQREAEVKKLIAWIESKAPNALVLVIYVRPGRQRIDAIDQMERVYYAAANTPVTLMGVVVDSAYVAYGEKQLEE